MGMRNFDKHWRLLDDFKELSNGEHQSTSRQSDQISQQTVREGHYCASYIDLDIYYNKN